MRNGLTVFGGNINIRYEMKSDYGETCCSRFSFFMSLQGKSPMASNNIPRYIVFEMGREIKHTEGVKE